MGSSVKLPYDSQVLWENVVEKTIKNSCVFCSASTQVGTRNRRGLQHSSGTDITVAVDANSVNENGFDFTYRFDRIIDGAAFFYSLTESGVQRYSEEDVATGFDSLFHG